MRPDEFQAFLRQQPFQPLRLHLSTGLVFEVRHPELALVARSYVELHVPADESPIPLASRKVVIILLHIVYIEFLGTMPSPTVN